MMISFDMSGGFYLTVTDSGLSTSLMARMCVEHHGIVRTIIVCACACLP